MGIFEKLMKIDRRYIFVMIAVAIILPTIYEVRMKIDISEPVKRIYDRVESLKPGSVVLISNDYDPAAKAELYPMTLAVLRHCFRKNLKVLAMNLWPQGAGLVRMALSTAAKEYKKENGSDYVFLGYKPGGAVVIIGMGQNLLGTFPKDADSKPLAELPLIKEKGIKTLKDIPLVIAIGAGVPGIDAWVVYGKDQYGFSLVGGCTGVMATDYYPYLNSGQLSGLMGGLKGAAEYETLVGRPDEATRNMSPQSFSHLVIIAFVILGNIALIVEKSKKKRR
ncbi:MAG: hypothetical protein N2234_04165 [Planctomycetota bacterium]|nr:hypothetical protein [Planctomycetota bacterium]